MTLGFLVGEIKYYTMKLSFFLINKINPLPVTTKPRKKYFLQKNPSFNIEQ